MLLVSLCKSSAYWLRPSKNGLVTDGITKLCCRGFVLALFHSTCTAYKIDSEHTRDYTKLFPVSKLEILQFTVNKIEVYHLFRLISDDFRLKCRKWLKRVPWFLPDVNKNG